jgi:flagellar basal body-associated protein FliL
MKRAAALWLWLGALATIAGCASTPAYEKMDCPLYDEVGPVRANPAGALERHLFVEASFRVCPPVEGLAEIKRKRIELKHEMLALLSSKTEAELNDPLRVEKLQKELLFMVNRKIMKKGQVEQVLITGFEFK